jgi:hypothetical protein
MAPFLSCRTRQEDPDDGEWRLGWRCQVDDQGLGAEDPRDPFGERPCRQNTRAGTGASCQSVEPSMEVLSVAVAVADVIQARNDVS